MSIVPLDRRAFLSFGAASVMVATLGCAAWRNALGASAVVGESPYGPLGTPDARGVALVRRRGDEGGLRVVEFARDRLHRAVVESARIGKHGQRIAAEPPMTEDIAGVVPELSHRALPGRPGASIAARRAWAA